MIGVIAQCDKPHKIVTTELWLHLKLWFLILPHTDLKFKGLFKIIYYSPLFIDLLFYFPFERGN